MGDPFPVVLDLNGMKAFRAVVFDVPQIGFRQIPLVRQDLFHVEPYGGGLSSKYGNSGESCEVAGGYL